MSNKWQIESTENKFLLEWPVNLDKRQRNQCGLENRMLLPPGCFKKTATLRNELFNSQHNNAQLKGHKVCSYWNWFCHCCKTFVVFPLINAEMRNLDFRNKFLSCVWVKLADLESSHEKKKKTSGKASLPQFMGLHISEVVDWRLLLSLFLSNVGEKQT